MRTATDRRPGAAGEPASNGRPDVARTAGWRVLEIVGSEGLSFLVFVAMARLLVPGEFGIVAIAGAMVQLGMAVLQRGLPDALVQAHRLDDRQIRCAFALSVAAGAAMAIGLVLLAWPLAWLLGREGFAPILAALAPILIVQAAAIPLHAVLQRRFDFRAIALRTLVATVAGGMLAMVLAWQGAGAWALVAQQWTVTLVGAALILRFSPIRPWPLTLRRDALEPLLAVARPVLFGSVLMQATRRLDAVALALFVTDHEVGLYFLVARLILSVQLVTTHSIGEVGLAVLARLQAEPKRLGLAIRRAFRLTAFACLVCFGGLLVCAGPLVPLLFGEAWIGAVRPLQVLAALTAFGALTTVSGQVLVAVGAAGDAGRLAAWSALLQLVALFGGAALGLMPMVVALGLVQTVLLWPALRRVAAHTGVSVAAVARDLLPIVAGWLVAIAAAWGAAHTSAGAAIPLVMPGLAFTAVMAACGLHWRRSLFGRLE
jgi:O-antigen/teichoic acid export membrane protein